MGRGWWIAGAFAALAGCGPAAPAVYPVAGVVVFPDGTPVKSGTIEFEPLSGPTHFTMGGYVDSLSRAGRWVSDRWKK